MTSKREPLYDMWWYFMAGNELSDKDGDFTGYQVIRFHARKVNTATRLTDHIINAMGHLPERNQELKARQLISACKQQKDKNLVVIIEYAHLWGDKMFVVCKMIFENIKDNGEGALVRFVFLWNRALLRDKICRHDDIHHHTMWI